MGGGGVMDGWDGIFFFIDGGWGIQGFFNKGWWEFHFFPIDG